MDSIQLALSDPYQNGGCNDGFQRDDALLVIAVISHEEDDNMGGYHKSQGDPPDWFNGVIKSKFYVESNVVVLGLVGQPSPTRAQMPRSRIRGPRKRCASTSSSTCSRTVFMVTCARLTTRRSLRKRSVSSTRPARTSLNRRGGARSALGFALGRAAADRFRRPGC
jgi:hypothetical protein